MGPSAAARKASLTAPSETLCSRSATRSTTDTVAVGTRKATPSIFPVSSGITFPTAPAAPVEVGMMLSAAARARRRSLCFASTRFWSRV